MKNVVDIASFFFPLHFWQLSCHNFFFPPFSVILLPQLVSILGTPPSMHFGHFTGKLGNISRTRISVISLPKFNFLSPLTYVLFLAISTMIQSLSLFCQITLNRTYNNNKHHFLLFLAKRLLAAHSRSPPTLILKKIKNKSPQR